MNPPCTCTTPFGLPVVPEVYRMNSGSSASMSSAGHSGGNFIKLAEIDFARAGRLEGFGIAGEDDDFLDKLQPVERFIDNALQRHRLAATEACIADDDDFGLRILDAVAQRGVSEAGIDDGVDRADASAGQHGDHAFERQRHVDDNAIALLHAKRLQAVRKAADIAIELAVGDDALAAIFGQPDESNLVAVCASWRGDRER